MTTATRLRTLAEQLETRAQVHTDTLDRLYIHDKQAHDTSALMLVEAATALRFEADAAAQPPAALPDHTQRLQDEHARLLALLRDFRAVHRGNILRMRELAVEHGIAISPRDTIATVRRELNSALLNDASELIDEIDPVPGLTGAAA